MRVFPDTNVLLSALATRGLCADLLRALLAEHDVLVGEPVLAELRRNLIGKLRMPAVRADEAMAFLGDLECAPAARNPVARIAGIDAADAVILACALQARADAFVTGDRALLALARAGGMPILAPRALWSRLQRGA